MAPPHSGSRPNQRLKVSGWGRPLPQKGVYLDRGGPSRQPKRSSLGGIRDRSTAKEMA
jgi:hypothetical protein